VISANPDHPCHERPRLRPVRTERSINLEEDFLSQIFSLIKSSNEAVSQVVNPLVVLANYAFPGAMVACQTSFHQLRIGCLQPCLGSASAALLVTDQRGAAKKSFILLFPF